MWPTELGFVPTSDAIETSLEHLNTNYIDLYLLHWPQCDHAVEWMHCEVPPTPLISSIPPSINIYHLA